MKLFPCRLSFKQRLVVLLSLVPFSLLLIGTDQSDPVENVVVNITEVEEYKPQDDNVWILPWNNRFLLRTRLVDLTQL